MNRIAFLASFFLLPVFLFGQNLSGISTRWSDSFVEWELFAFPEPDTTKNEEEQREEDEESEEISVGEFKLRWLNVKDDWSEWDFEINDRSGTIRQKWKNDPTQWELRTYDGEVVTMRVSWANDLTEWRVTDNGKSINFESRWKNQYDEWLCDDKTYGKFYLYTVREQDPRDWAIEDSTKEEITLSMKLAMVFLAVYHASPRI